MSKNNLLRASAALALALASPAESQLGPLTGAGGSWILRPAPLGVSSATRSAKFGEFLFRQALHPVAEAKPLPGQSIILLGAFKPLGTVVLDGHRFIATTGGSSATPFCATDLTNPSKSIMHSSKLRLCLIDTDQDGAFDYQVTTTNGFKQTFSPLYFWLPSATPAPIRYQLLTNPAGPTLTAGVVIRKEGKSFALRFAIEEKGKPELLDIVAAGSGPFTARPQRLRTVGGAISQRVLDATSERFTAAQLPVRIGAFGAVVEIVSIVNDQLSYRIISALDPAISIPVARTAPFPDAQ